MLPPNAVVLHFYGCFNCSFCFCDCMGVDKIKNECFPWCFIHFARYVLNFILINHELDPVLYFEMYNFQHFNLMILDVGMITLNQYILLDPILLFFVSGSVMGMVKVKANQHNSFTSQWWLWLIFTGVMLAGAISVKFVGLFAIILVGLYTIVELWEILGDLSEPVVSHIYL